MPGSHTRIGACCLLPATVSMYPRRDPFSQEPQISEALVVAHNWTITPSIINEARGGFTRVHTGYSTAITAQQSLNALGLTSPPLPNIPPAVWRAGSDHDGICGDHRARCFYSSA